MRPIPATSLGDAHGLLRAIEKRGRLRTDEFVTEFSLDELFAPGLENALGRLRHFISYARAAGLVKEDRGVVELTEVGRRYVRAGDDDRPYEISPQQAEWLRRQLRELHMTDSIFHGLAIGISLLASCPPGVRVSTMDFGRSMAYLGRAGWDNENTLEIQGERHLRLLQEMEMIDENHRVTPTGEQLRTELTLPVHMSLIDIAGQQNPGGPDAVRAAAEREWSQPIAAPPAPEVQPEPPVATEDGEDDGYHDVGPGAWAPGEPHPPIVPRAAARPEEPSTPAPASSGDPLARFAGTAAPADPAASVGPPPPGAGAPPAGADASIGPPPRAEAEAPAGGDVAVGPAPGGDVSSGQAAAGGDVAVGPAASGGDVAAGPAAPGGGVEATPPVGGEAAAGPAIPGAGVFGAPPAGGPAARGGGVEAAPPASGGVGVGAAAPGGDVAAGPAAPGGDVAAGASAPVGGVAVGPAAPAGGAAATPLAGGGIEAAPPAGAAASAGLAAPAGGPAGAPPAGLASPAAGVVVAPSGGPGAPGAAALAGVVGSPAPVAPQAQPLSPAGELSGPAFVGAGAIRTAARAAGLRLPESVYANVAAGLAAGKHLLLTGAPGAGKTTLAMAVAQAAAQAGRAHGATVVTAAPGWAPQDLLVESAGRGRWVIADELDRAEPDEALGALSSFLAGVPVAFAGGDESRPADGWRIIATWGGGPPRASAAVLRRFAVIEVIGPPADDLREALHEAAGGDAEAAHAAERLLVLAELAPLGAGVFLDAARHAAARRATAPADGATLSREVFAAYVAPLLGELDEDGEHRVREVLGAAS